MDKKQTEDLMDCLGVVSVEEVVSHEWLKRKRWYGHVELKEKSDWISACRLLKVEVQRVKGEIERRGTSVTR